ncbi:MAG: helix-hairpin-helix domain-containing protein [Actinomycetota bacterium]
MIKRALIAISGAARASPAEVGLIAMLGVAVVAGSVLVFMRTSPAPAPPVRKVEAAPDKTDVLVVHVAGLVSKPGVYELSAGSRVKDAIEAAGGPVDGADLDTLNLAAEVADGTKIYVPRSGQTAQPATAASGQPAEKVNLNTATQSELESLPGIGPVIAERIIAFRERNGGFASVRQLLEVEGIGPKKFEAIEDLVVV